MWAARISTVKERLRLSNRMLRLAPLGPAVVAMLAIGFLVGHVAPRRIVPVVSGPETWTHARRR